MISLLMPIRDAAATLGEALQSVSEQTFLNNGGNLECILIDDGSVDSTPRLLRAWAEKPENRRIKLNILNTGGTGVARAVNAGLARCQGEWIARLDSDDRCHRDRLDRQLAYSRSNPGLKLIGCVAKHWVPNPQHALNTAGMSRYVDWANGLSEHGEMALAHWIDMPIPQPTWFVQRGVFEKVGLYDESREVPEDYEWLHRFFLLAESDASLRAGKVTGEALLDWRETPGRLTRTDPAYSEDAFLRVKLDYFAKRKPLLEKELFLFGLGPKGKKIAALAQNHGDLRIKAIVDVNPRHDGILYGGAPVMSPADWESYRKKKSADDVFVITCLGTPETRIATEHFCLKNGLELGKSFLSF